HDAERRRRLRPGTRRCRAARAPGGRHMTARLRALRDEELPAYRESAEHGYANSIEEHGGMPRALAEEKARRDFELLWPDGRPTDGQAVFGVEDVETGETVGYLWVAERDNQ